MTRQEVESAVADASEGLRRRGVRGVVIVAAAEIDGEEGYLRVMVRAHGLAREHAILALQERRQPTTAGLAAMARKAAMN